MIGAKRGRKTFRLSCRIQTSIDSSTYLTLLQEPEAKMVREVMM